MFSGKWPEPQVGPNRSECGNLIAVTEAERREKFLALCGNEHSLMSLIQDCIHNDPQERPRLEEIVKKQAEMVLQFSASSTNRLEMLRHIKVADACIAQQEKSLTSVERYLASKKLQVIDH